MVLIMLWIFSRVYLKILVIYFCDFYLEIGMSFEVLFRVFKFVFVFIFCDVVIFYLGLGF